MTIPPADPRRLASLIALRGIACAVLVCVVPILAATADSEAAGADSRLASAAREANDVAAARALFEENLDAIRRRDRDAYLACYLDAPTLVRSSFTGPALGYAGLEESAGDAWPDLFEGRDLRLVGVRPGIVYGTYRYRVRYGSEEQSGLSERLFIDTGNGWKIAVTTAFESPAGTPPPPLALVGGTLHDGRGGAPLPDAVVVTRGGHVACAGTRAGCPVPDGVDAIEARGLHIVPGLVDTHVHFSQTGWADGRPDAFDVRAAFPYEDAMRALREDPEETGRMLLCSGVTSALDVGGYAWTTRFARESAARTDVPRLAATGPVLSTIDHWLNLPGERQIVHIGDADAAREAVRYVASLGAAAVKVWFIAPRDEDVAARRPAVLAAGEAARELGLPLVVHATRLEAARVAVEAGASLLVHSVEEGLIDDALLAAMKDAGTAYCPTLTVRDGYVRTRASAVSGTPPRIDDPNRCLAPALRERVLRTHEALRGRYDEESLAAARKRNDALSKTARTNLARVRQAGLPIVLGTDAGNPLTLHGPSIYAEAEAMQDAGMPAREVLLAATRDAARAAGLGELAGTIEPGRPADLLILAADPSADISALRRTTHVMRAGELRSTSELAGRPREAAALPAAVPEEKTTSASCSGAGHRQFDFWLGSWEVRTPDGQLAGTNTIEPVHGGCALLESWRSVRGGTGTSLNAYRPADGTWHQTWVDASGTLLELAGGLAQGEMVLRGEVPGAAQSGTRHEIRWTPLDDGRVRQRWRTSKDGGASWTDAFVGIYNKR